MGPITSAKAVGATVRAMNAYLSADYEFGLAVEEAIGEALEEVSNAAWRKAQSGDWAVARELLQARMPEDWLPVKDINMRFERGGADDIDIDALHKKLAAHTTKEVTAGDGQEEG